MIPDNVHNEIYGMFFKEIGVNDISEAIKKVGYGKQFSNAFKKSNAYETYLNGKVHKKLIESEKRTELDARKEYINQRNKMVITLREQGLKHKEIGDKLSMNTTLVYSVLRRNR